MRRTRRISVALTPQQLLQLKAVVEVGEFASSAAVMREALRVWLRGRSLHAGRLGAARFSRSLEARRAASAAAHIEPAERVELLFDAGDAKA
jgi:Arc/MetJ-type ribon-helix-helix transcriptional regulator